MFEIPQLMVWIPALPLAAAVITAALGRRVLGQRSHLPGVAAAAGSFVLSVMLLVQLRAEVDEKSPAAQGGVEHVHNLWTWSLVKDAIPSSSIQGAGDASAVPRQWRDLHIDIALRADPLTAIMLVMVTFVSMLVLIYSRGYMHGDAGYWRFFAYVNLFVFSMTMLVSASNFLLLYVFWEAVGVCSYLLIGFWYEKPAAAAAGMKAFLVNRIGDFGFAVALFLIWVTYGTLNYHDVLTPEGDVAVAGVLGQARLAGEAGGFLTEAAGGSIVPVAICLLLLVGACGKSAQFPLHVWLPDAMEGPSPVSALIHAATMVTAGVYMIARCTPLFMAAPTAQQAVAVVGAFTALLAGLIALTQTDLKRVLAYSTISQLGYMFLALGMGTLAGITAAMFHLFTHAFFKALLFLGAGSVMHAMGGVIDMRSFSGLRRKLPITFWTFLVGSLALAGVVPFAGFWSKDQILLAVYEQMGGDSIAAIRNQWLLAAAMFTALLTAFYTFRALFMTFFGPERIPPEAAGHAHESPRVMWLPLVILAALATAVGGYFEMTGGFASFLAATPQLAYEPVVATVQHHAAHDAHTQVAVASTLVVLTGAGLAAYFYLGDRVAVAWLARVLGPLYSLSAGKFFFDPLYRVLVVWPLAQLARLSFWVDRRMIDAAVDRTGRLPLKLGSMMRAMQIGMVQFYALAMVLGLVVLLGSLTLLR